MEHSELYSKRRCYQHKVHNPTSGFQRNRSSGVSDKTLSGIYRPRCDTCSIFYIFKETEIQTEVLRALLSLNIPAATKRLHTY